MKQRRWNIGSNAKDTGSVDYSLLVIIFMLLAFGLVMVFSASSANAHYVHGDAMYFFKRQLLWAVFGVAAMWMASKSAIFPAAISAGGRLTSFTAPMAIWAASTSAPLTWRWIVKAKPIMVYGGKNMPRYWSKTQTALTSVRAATTSRLKTSPALPKMIPSR